MVLVIFRHSLLINKNIHFMQCYSTFHASLGLFQDKFEDTQGIFIMTDNTMTIKPLSLVVLKVFLVGCHVQM